VVTRGTTDAMAVLTSRAERVAPTSRLQTLARRGLGAFLIAAGTGHLTVVREEFQGQVPPWVPMDPDDVVLLSGAAEIALGSALIALPKERVRVGVVVATFFTAIFPGNISQYRQRRDALGLDTDRKRFLRLFAQPVLVGLALWSTGVVPRR
jgi:uncharacterized membrane protein